MQLELPWPAATPPSLTATIRGQCAIALAAPFAHTRAATGLNAVAVSRFITPWGAFNVAAIGADTAVYLDAEVTGPRGHIPKVRAREGGPFEPAVIAPFADYDTLALARGVLDLVGGRSEGRWTLDLGTLRRGRGPVVSPVPQRPGCTLRTGALRRGAALLRRCAPKEPMVFDVFGSVLVLHAGPAAVFLWMNCGAARGPRG